MPVTVIPKTGINAVGLPAASLIDVETVFDTAAAGTAAVSTALGVEIARAEAAEALLAPTAQGAVAATTSATLVSPSRLASVVVTVSTATTLDIGAGIPGQTLRIEVKQDATGGRIVTLGTSIARGTDLPAYTASTAANARDLLQFINSGGSYWMLVAVSHGFST